MDGAKTSTGSNGKPETSAVPEGAQANAQGGGSTAQRDSVQTLPFQSQGSTALGNFDLLASLGEAEQLALALKSFADLIPDPRWQAISKAMDIAIQAHDRINQARANS